MHLHPNATAARAHVESGHPHLALRTMVGLTDEDLSGGPEETRMRLISIVDEAFDEIRSIVPRSRNGHAGTTSARPESHADHGT